MQTTATRTNPTLTLAAALACAGLAVTAACQSQQQSDIAVIERPETPTEAQPARIAVSGPVDRPSGRGLGEPKLLSRQTLARQRRAPENMHPQIFDAAPGQVRQVKYTARGAEAEDFMRAVAGDLLERPFLVEKGVSGGITIDIDQEMTDAEIYDLLGAVASLMGWTLQERDELLIVSQGQGMTRASAAPILNGRSADPTDMAAMRVFRFDHLSAGQAAEACKEFISETARTVVVGRSLVVADRVKQLNRIGALLYALDVPAFDGVELWTYELSHQTPDAAGRVLTSIAAASGLAGGNDARVAFVPLAGANRLMVISRDPGVQPMVRRWIEQMDTPPADARRQRYFYHIQHFAPSELVRLLNEFLAGDLEGDAGDPLDSRMRLSVSQEEDLLLIYATPQDYADLVALLEQIDRPRQQVFVQSVIAEVSLSDNLAFGVEHFLEASLGDLDVELFGSAPLTGTPGGSAFFVGTDGFSVIEALDRTTDVNLLSAPNLFVQDKGEAKIQVGGETPVLSSARETDVQLGGDSTVRNEIEYRDTGVTLTVQPKINEGGSVTLQITQEIRDAVENSSSTIGSPEFTVRIIETTVTVPHGQTLLLGGIITNDSVRTVDRVPVLGRLPLIGGAFRGFDNQTTRRELLLAITPTVVSNPEDTPMITGDFLAAVGGVRSAMERAGLGFDIRNPGSLNPYGLPGEPAPQDDAQRDAPDTPPPAAPEGSRAFSSLALAAADDANPDDAPVHRFLLDLAAIVAEREGRR